MLYRLVFTDSEGTTFVQYGKNAVYHRPSFMSLSTAESFCGGSNITVHNQLATAEEGIRRYNHDTGDNIDISIEFATSKSGPWTLTTTHENVKSHIESLMCI